jgi:hypothetical protein
MADGVRLMVDETVTIRERTCLKHVDTFRTAQYNCGSWS